MLASLVDREGDSIDGQYHRDLRLTLTEIVDEMIDPLARIDPNAIEGQIRSLILIRLHKLGATSNMCR